MTMKIKIWGARGSLPSPYTPDFVENRIREVLEEFSATGGKRETVGNFLASLPREKLGGFGGNTSCVEVKTDQQRLIIDGGSGIRLLGYELLKGLVVRGKVKWICSLPTSIGITWLDFHFLFRFLSKGTK